jgi:imidazolonepropionase-like amidohydrolase
VLAFSRGAIAQTAGEASPDATVVYRNTTLIDGSGAQPRSGVDILVQGSRIAAIGVVNAPQGARIVDASGLYVVPGLIDAHVHIATPPDARAARGVLRRQLYSGVTAVRVMADDLRSVAELSRDARVGEIPSPDIYFAALMAGESFFADPRTIAAAEGETPGRVPWMQAVTEDTDIRLAVAMARGTHATGIKIYANLPASLVRRITQEAHRQNIPVWAHTMVYPATPAEVASAGVDVMSHACSLAHQGQSERPTSYASRTPIHPAPFLASDNAAVESVVRDMARRGIILDATVLVYAEQERLRAENPERRAPLCTAALSYAMARQAYRAGVRIAAGTDGDAEWRAPFPSLIEEMELLQNEVGMAPMDVLRAATQTAAEATAQGDDMGVIAPGRLANMVFTREDPSADVANLRSVVFTVRRGLEFQRSDYTPIRADEAAGD